jgi:hypothetical protein
VGSDTRIGNSLHRIFDAANSNMESTPKRLKLTSKGLWNVIFCIIYAQSWHMWTPDNDFWGLMIPLMAIPSIGFLMLQIPT